MKATTRPSQFSAWFGAFIILVGLALLGWVLSSINELHGRLSSISKPLATAAIVILLGVLLCLVGLGVRFLWRVTRPASNRQASPAVFADPEKAAKQGIEAASQQLEFVADEIARSAMQERLETVADDLASSRFTIVVFGTTSAGKTSTINALLGQKVGKTDPLTGTTKQGESHTYTIDGFEEGHLRLIDTPGLSEIGAGGLLREEQARALAAEADLLLFVVDQDLRDIELKPMQSLAKLGKRSILVFNKRDLYPDAERNAIAARQRDRLSGMIEPEDIFVCAANPRPLPVVDEQGNIASQQVVAEPDVDALTTRIAEVLRADGKTLLANNVLLRAKRIARDAKGAIHAARVEKAEAIIRRFQWTTAAVMFVNPVPGLGALAAMAVNYQMITEIAAVFGVSLTMDAAKRMAGELGQIMLKMGVVTVATNILGKALKASIVGFVAGGLIEAVAGAYLTRLSGGAFIDYFAQDQDWGDGGMEAAIERRFDLQKKSDVVSAFIAEATRRLMKSNTEE